MGERPRAKIWRASKDGGLTTGGQMFREDVADKVCCGGCPLGCLECWEGWLKVAALVPDFAG